MRAGTLFGVCLVIMAAAFGVATTFVAWTFNRQAALGEPIIRFADFHVHAPWKLAEWHSRWGDAYPRPFAFAYGVILIGVLASCCVALLRRHREAPKPFGRQAWADFADLNAAQLFAAQGAVLGRFQGEIIAYDGTGHQLLIGPSRSGKGRGHVVPTLLAWSGSALVLDVKGELDHGDSRHGFPGASGFRALLGPVIRFAPTQLDSHAFNPLFEVRRGVHEVRDVQNIVEALVQPHGESRGAELFWNNRSKDIITGVVIHVLHCEPVERKTLAVVREKLRDLDRTAEEMRLTLHRRNPATGQAEVHPEALHASESYLSGEERLRSSVKATAESVFGLFADPLIAEKTSRSDFRLGDLMCGERPVTMFLQPPPSDAPRLAPLMRLIINLAARSLMEDQTRDSSGREKKHRLLMLLDEFPQLGRLDFFEKMMGAMAGYGVKIYLVCQSLNHIIKVYGRDNVIVDNVHIVTAFSATDPETAKRVSDMAGEVWEVRPQLSENRPRSWFGSAQGSITYREERRPLIGAAEVRRLPDDQQLIFVAGTRPIRAGKLRFDEEPIFAARLRPAAAQVAMQSCDHDWVNVSALGSLAPPDKRSRPNARPRLAASAVDEAQVDLFASPVPSPATAAKISDIASACLQGSHPTPAGSASEPSATKRPRATGV